MSASRFLVSGTVQGVGFRWFVARHGRQLGLRGFARNLPDGRVEVLVCGAGSALDDLEALLRRGPAHARVTGVERNEISDDVIDAKSFDIR